MNISVKMGKVINKVVMVVILLIALFPIYYLLTTTFKTPAEALLSPLGLPQHITFTNYVKAFRSMDYFNALANNLYIAVIAVSFLVVFSSMASYAITRSSNKAVKFTYSVFLMGLIVPFQVSIIPLYKIISGVKLMNTLSGVAIIAVFCINLPLSIFLFRGFINTVPKELEEAADIDGCGTFACFWRIIFPLLKPIIATVAILDLLAVWNDFMTPLLFIQDPAKRVMLQKVYENVGPFSTDWTSFFPMLVLATVPLVVFYLLLQRNIIEGVVAGAVKA